VSLFWNRTATLSTMLTNAGLPTRAGIATTSVTSETALRHSAVWACLRLRADLISTTPLDVFRRVAGVQMEMTKPTLLVSPGGSEIGMEEWLYSTQFDLDRFGNAFGIITLRDKLGFPQRVDLVPANEVTVRVRDGQIDHYQIGTQRYEPRDIWHERQFTVPGIHVGLSPIMYAAYSIGTYLSAQEFALDWFGSGAAPSGHLRNTLVPTIEPGQADAIKSRFKNAVKGRDLFVTGRDWEYTMAQVPANTTMFLDEMKYGIADVCRFLGVPGDLIDAETSTGSITYASVTQRNLQLLIINLGPAYVRREAALSRALPVQRYVKFNTDAILRMDTETRHRDVLAQVSGRTLSPSEARELDNRAPFTEEQMAEFDRLFGNPAKPAPAKAVGA
jgi:HK97 family phage portal protein